MKKLAKSFLMLSMASLAVLSSCKKDDTNDEVTAVKVSIAGTPSGSTLEAGTVLKLTINAEGNPDNKVKKITVTRIPSNGGTIFIDEYSDVTVSQDIYDTLTAVDVTYTYSVLVDGEKGTPATASYEVKTVAPYGLIEHMNTPVEFSGQTQNTSLTYFLQLVNPFAPYDRDPSTFTSNVDNIDLGFFYGDANKFTLGSPSDATLQSVYDATITFTGAKVTSLSKTSVTAAQFDAIVASQSDSAILAIAAGTTTWTGLANNLAVGNVLVYKTAEGKKGLIKVMSASGTSASAAKMTIDVVAQD